MSTTIKPYGRGRTFRNYTDARSLTEMHNLWITSYLVVAATCEVAYGVMVDTVDVLRKTPLWRHKTKYHAQQALRMYTNMQHEMLTEMTCRRQFWLDYMDEYDVLIKPLIDKLKKHIDRTLVEYRKESCGHEKAMMLSAFNTITLSCEAFRGYFAGEQGKRLAAKSSMRAIVRIAREWKAAIEAIDFDRNIDLLKYKNCVKAVENIHKFIRNPQVITLCAEKALRLNPDCDIRLKQKRNQI